MLILAGALCGAGLQASSLSAQRPADRTKVPAADRSPVALQQLGDAAIDVFDAARSGDWTAADERLTGVNRAAMDLPPRLPEPDLVAQMRSRRQALRSAVHGRRAAASMDDANAIARIAAELSEHYQTVVPFEIVMLSYYGRVLETGVSGRRLSVLKRARADLEGTWNRVERTVLRRGDVDDARAFNDIVVQLDAARRPADFARPADAELALALRMTHLFQAGP